MENRSRNVSVILNNLLSNSIKYHDENKQDRYIEVRTTDSGNECVITVEDNGIGITREFHDRIFNMFFRASEKSVGSGLGLYIARETVQKLNGAITYTSPEGAGSAFRVTIPCEVRVSV
jgi:signal transduction histidine kinase